MIKMYNIHKFIKVSLLASIWVNISSFARYFGYIKEDMIIFLPEIELLNNCDLKFIISYIIYNIILSFVYVFNFYICRTVFKTDKNSIVISSILSTTSTFILFWINLYILHLASFGVIMTCLPLAFLEAIFASYIASKYHIEKN